MTRLVPGGNLSQGEFRKKTAPGAGDEGHSLEAFYHRLCELCCDHGESFGGDRAKLAEDQAKRAHALAHELKILKTPGQTFEEFRASESHLRLGSEHLVELDDEIGRVVKLTAPPKFGLVPAVISSPCANVRDDPRMPAFKQQLEFVHATPLEYLARWIAANQVFEDDVRLTSVVEWSDGRISFSISQPQYDGEPATVREIETFFTQAGWTRILDDNGHLIFFNYAFNVLAVDALPRNCYVKDGNLLPFDVILCHPTDSVEDFLKLY